MQRRHFIRIAAPAVALASCDKPAEHSSNEELVIEGRDLPLGGPKVEPVPRHDYQEPEAFDLNTVSSATVSINTAVGGSLDGPVDSAATARKAPPPLSSSVTRSPSSSVNLGSWRAAALR